MASNWEERIRAPKCYKKEDNRFELHHSPSADSSKERRKLKYEGNDYLQKIHHD